MSWLGVNQAHVSDNVTFAAVTLQPSPIMQGVI